MDPVTVDVVILGAGSGGENLASQLVDRGRSVVLVEERLVGGECPYFACMPSKAMLHDAHLGRSFSEAAARRDEVAEHFDDAEHVEHLTGKGVEVLRGRGRFVAPGRIAVAGEVAEILVDATDVVIATGASERTIEADGVEVWTSEDAWTASERPDELLVVGGGPVGVEVATAYRRFGSDVVLVDRGQHLLHAEDPAVADDVAQRLADEGVDLVMGVGVEQLDPAEGGRTLVKLADGSSRTVDRVVTCMGKVPRLDGIGLEVLGLDPGDVTTGTDGRVAGAERLWAIGDVSGHPAYTHTANAMADVIAANLAGDGGRDLHVDHLPRCVYVVPPLAAAGTTSPDVPHVRATAHHRELARAITDQTKAGTSILVVGEEDRRILGWSATGAGVDEMAGMLALAIRTGVTVDELAATVMPFPTHSEIVPLLARRAIAELDASR